MCEEGPHDGTAPLLYLACVMLFVGVLIDKGIGTIIPGFVPEPWGKIPRYSPTWVELTVTAGSGPSGPSCSRCWPRPPSRSSLAGRDGARTRTRVDDPKVFGRRDGAS